MTALAKSLKRIWAATVRAPHLTGWATSGSPAGTSLADSIYEDVLALTEVARQSAPAVLVIVLNLFR